MIKARAFELARELESGRHTQIQSWLQKKLPNKHVGRCCLGVACVLAGLKPRYSTEANMDGHFVATYEGETGTMPPSVQKYFGFFDSQGSCGRAYRGRTIAGMDVIHDGGHNNFGSLMGANDAGIPFPLIAKMIRKYWRYL